ncbi:hypothetical protein JDFR1000234_22 [uncultured archaeal virus]|uniref:Uncharacterized protein n=1 Tax=uncultured archaeal virus TaxID=1960247 RepID=A0A1S5Y300_9VIRU|nr:hypothetical protein JDFR1000234_22 [uncultured archaeal virus]
MENEPLYLIDGIQKVKLNIRRTPTAYYNIYETEMFLTVRWRFSDAEKVEALFARVMLEPERLYFLKINDGDVYEVQIVSFDLEAPVTAEITFKVRLFLKKDSGKLFHYDGSTATIEYPDSTTAPPITVRLG